MLSVCFIARNEEKNLPRALASVRNVADEIIVADTGSTDRTVEIAKESGAVVCHFPWCDDFSAARMEEVGGPNAKEFFEPNLYLFDAYPGGIGFSEPLFRAHELLIHKTRELIQACPCDSGCPSCVGPAGDLAPRAKEAALAILDRICANAAGLAVASN